LCGGFFGSTSTSSAGKELAGVSFGRGGPTITHLLFADNSIVFLEASQGNMDALKAVLEQYEECSGQTVNLQKSSIFFGKKCGVDNKMMLKSRIGIACEALFGCYLGLPTVVGRSKQGAFKHLTDRSRGKVSGWNKQGISMAGKETLIKSVLQAISTYTMGCFQLNKGQCSELSSVVSLFW
jgi:hypothetical protein